MNRRPLEIINKFKQFEVGEIGVSAITVSELHYGVVKSKNPSLNKQRVEEFLTPLEIIPYDEIAANAYGDIRHQLEKSGETIGPLDMLLAAHTLSNNFVLITNNEKEFRRVNNLKIENWIEQ
jgi:tRNA(fMet)-specific endonuclease VapC